MDLIVSKALIANKQFPIRTRLVLAQLLDHRNARTGKCNPKRKTLASELGISPSTVTRSLRRLREAGFILSRQGQHTGFYQIQDGHFDHPQDGHFDPPARALPYMNLSKVERSGGVHGSSSTAEAAPPLQKPKPTPTRPPEQPPILRKPPVMEDGTLSIVRESLEDLAPRVHMPPPDEDLVRKVVDAARGAPGENIHATLVALFKRGRFGTMRSWGLVPVLIDACFQPPDRAAIR